MATDKKESPLFKPHKSQDEYARYFNQICRVFNRLIEVIVFRAEERNEPNKEAMLVSLFLKKMLMTIEALRLKYTYNPDHGLEIDLTESGFPSFSEINNIVIDLRLKKNRLAELPALANLKQDFVDHLFKYAEQSDAILWKISERAYFEALDGENLFLPFTPGSLILQERTDSARRYVYTWGCYDFELNRPYIHFLLFEQNQESQPLEEGGDNFARFLATVEEQGSRMTGLAIVAQGIDINLKDIHPKVLKRLCIGPVCTKEYSRDPEDLYGLLSKIVHEDDDFILLFEDEILVSSGQRNSRSLLSLGQVREIFCIPDMGADLECNLKKISLVHKYMLIPHSACQLMDCRKAYAEYTDRKKYTYDRRGAYVC